MYIYDDQHSDPQFARDCQPATSRHSQHANAYIQPSETLGLIAAPKDQKAAQEKKLVSTITKALALMQDARKFLQSESQRDLLTAMLEMLSNFFPTGHGVIDERGKVTRLDKKFKRQ